MDFQTLFLLLMGIVVGGVLALLFLRFEKTNKQNPLEERFEVFTRTFLGQLNEVTRQVNERLSESMALAQRSHHATSQAVGSVTEGLARLEESSRRIFEVGKDLASLQDILRAPKLRGIFGEYLLGDLLAQILPKKHFALQYRFKSGEQVDAIIYLRDLKIPIDAKFPLENFQKMHKAQEEVEKKTFLRAFAQDIRRHVDAISTKYIVPEEGTADFAIMYIPAENVYYEAFVHDPEKLDLATHAFSKRVIPVSPNSFYAYLQAILVGLRGMQVEKGARDILTQLSSLRGEFTRFQDRFRILGTHVRDAEKSYGASERHLDRIGDRLQRLETPEEKPKLEEPDRKS